MTHQPSWFFHGFVDLPHPFSVQEELDYAPDWITKARYRRGQAQNGKQNFEQALADLKVVQRLQPTDAGVKKEIVALKLAADKHREKEKKMYSKMF